MISKEKAREYYLKYKATPEYVERKRRREKAWRLKNQDMVRAARQRRYRANPTAKWKQDVKKYGITIDQYFEMVKTQSGLCLICNKTPTYGRLAVDHDHETGKVRGLLCMKCNLALGMIESQGIDCFVNYLRKANV